MRILHIILKNAFYVCVLVFVGTYFFRYTLPNPDELLTNLIQEPSQYTTSASDITISQDGYTALLSPQFVYEISGLVVTQYESDTWYDYIHKNDPFNTKDVCVVWGENIETDIYKKGDFSSGEFTCYWYFDSQELFSEFSHRAISNNHLIPANDEIAKSIEQVRIGDQISFSGYLVTYQVTDDETGQIIGLRGTSTTRDDTSDGACEVIYVTDFEIVKKNPEFIPRLHGISIYAEIGLFAILAIIFIYQISRKGYREPE